MKIKLTKEASVRLREFLEAHEDAEALSTKEYVADFYESDPPFSVDLVFGRDAVYVDGAAVLRYDEEQDGWYIAERILEVGELRALLVAVGALEP